MILAVIGQIGVGGGTNAVLEFVGPGAEALSIDERLAVANMAVEAGVGGGHLPGGRRGGRLSRGPGAHGVDGGALGSRTRRSGNT